MSGLFDSIDAAPAAGALTAEKLATMFRQLRERSDAERIRRAQPGYCQHQDVVLHPADAAHLDGKQCPWGCGQVLRTVKG